MIALTVGLPLYRSRAIAWLALESLCRQRGVEFGWELIVAEEQGEESLGHAGLVQYEERLRKAGCESILYIALRDWIPLGAKWQRIARRSDPESRAFIIQDSDCYSQPRRLVETLALIDAGADWVQSRLGIFYDLVTGQSVLYDYELAAPTAKTALNMGVRTELMRRLPENAERRLLNGWTYRQCQQILECEQNRELEVGWNTSANWKLGVDTHGCNTITRRRKFMAPPKPPFREAPFDIRKILPVSIVEGLDACREFVRQPLIGTVNG